VIIDLNPSDFECWCYEIADGPDAVKIHSTYLDNPFLGEKQIAVIEGYKRADPEGLMWKVYGLGLRGASEDQIYTHHKMVPELPGKGALWYGLDFGFNVPTAMVKVELYEGAVYVEEVLYQTRLTTSELAEVMKGLNIGQYDEIYCDSAEPKTIQELYNEGFNAMPGDKDVTEGIRKVKGMPLYITERSVNLRKEMAGYKWKKDKNVKVLDEPDKAAGNDHLCDAMRYAIFSRLRNGEAEFFMI
jgi:phage terminase large subunit